MPEGATPRRDHAEKPRKTAPKTPAEGKTRPEADPKEEHIRRKGEERKRNTTKWQKRKGQTAPEEPTRTAQQATTESEPKKWKKATTTPEETAGRQRKPEPEDDRHKGPKDIPRATTHKNRQATQGTATGGRQGAETNPKRSQATRRTPETQTGASRRHQTPQRKRRKRCQLSGTPHRGSERGVQKKHQKTEEPGPPRPKRGHQRPEQTTGPPNPWNNRSTLPKEECKAAAPQRVEETTILAAGGPPTEEAPQEVEREEQPPPTPETEAGDEGEQRPPPTQGENQQRLKEGQPTRTTPDPRNTGG